MASPLCWPARVALASLLPMQRAMVLDRSCGEPVSSSVKTPLLLVVLLSRTVPLLAQIHYGIGLAAGAQRFQRGSLSDTKLITAVELFGRSPTWCASVVGERADSHMSVVHSDVLHAVTPHLWVGGGPSYVSLEGFKAQTTWNVEAELVRPLARVEILVRARYYAFHVEAFRDEARTRGPGVYGAVRYAFGR